MNSVQIIAIYFIYLIYKSFKFKQYLITANALKYNIDKIPHERKQQLVDSILNYYKENVLDQRLLDRACSIDKKYFIFNSVFFSLLLFFKQFNIF